MALKTKTVKLSAPIVAFDRRYTELVLREPSGSLYLELGPLSQNFRSGEIESSSDLPGVLLRYLERCVANVTDPAVAMAVILLDLSLEDGMRLRRTFGSFFGEAAERVMADDKPPAAGVNPVAA